MIKKFDFNPVKTKRSITVRNATPHASELGCAIFRGKDLVKIKATAIEVFIKSGHDVIVEVKTSDRKYDEKVRAAVLFASHKTGCDLAWLAD